VIIGMLWTLLKYIAVVTLAIFILYQLFTDPVGSAQFVGDVVGGIKSGIEALITFATNIKPS